MEKKIGRCIAAAILIIVSFNSFSQKNAHRVPAWVSDNGYWIVENNIHEPLEHAIRFYNNENVLIGKTTISGKKLNFEKRKVKMQLKEMLESSLMVWNKQKAAGGNVDLANKP